jgi:UDP-GlcNAc:undecaprenyl-phosphate GlcNAc-1-phosphate transferase
MHFEVIIPYLAVFATALVVTLATVPLAKIIAIRLKAIDYPSARRINKVPVPRMGGIAMLLGLICAVVVQYFGTLAFGWPSAFIPHPSLDINYWGIAVSVLVIFLTGAIDDVYSLRPWQKLLGQVIAGSIAAGSGLLIGHIVNPFGEGALYLGWIAYPITVLYLVCFANIINLIDGLDGLAAGLSGIVSLALFVIMFAAGRVDAAALAIAICGVCVGFLRYNFNPASIFMGDSGALMLGFLLGTVSLLGVRRVAALTTLIVPLIIAGVPIIDTAAAIIRRKRGHVSIGTADKGHIQHRLIAGGFNQRQACLLIYGWSALLAISAVIITQVSPGWRIAIIAVLFIVSAIFVIKLHLFEPVLYHRGKAKTHRNIGTHTKEK